MLQCKAFYGYCYKGSDVFQWRKHLNASMTLHTYRAEKGTVAALMWKAFIWPKITTLNRMLPLAPSANLHSERWVHAPKLHNSQWLYLQLKKNLNLTHIWTRVELWLVLMAFLCSVQFEYNAQIKFSGAHSRRWLTDECEHLIWEVDACALWPSCKWTLTELTACYRRKAPHIFCGLSEHWRRIEWEKT